MRVRERERERERESKKFISKKIIVLKNIFLVLKIIT